jgi:hypothetical protein
MAYLIFEYDQPTDTLKHNLSEKYGGLMLYQLSIHVIPNHYEVLKLTDNFNFRC